MSSRTPAVCIAGTLCDGRLFAPLLDRLPINAKIIDVTDCDQVAVAASRALTDAPPAFLGIGFSLGGFVVLDMLRQAPERLIAVILISGNAHPDAPMNAAARRQEVAAARGSGMAAFIRAALPRYVAEAARKDTSVEASMIAMADAVGHAGHERQAEMNIARPDLRAVVRASPVPILVVAGSNDALCPRERYAFAASGPMSKLTVLRDVGHFVPLEAPEAAARAITDFLKEIEQ